MKTNNSGRNSQGNAHRRVVVVGGGISGLAAAHRLHELDATLDVTLLESGGRLGGVLETSRPAGFLVEAGADGFITNVPWGTDLCRRLGIAGELIQTNPIDRRTFVVSRGKLELMPAGFIMMAPTQFWPTLTTPTLSWRGKLRLACEPFIRRRVDSGQGDSDGNDDESTAAFVRRRLGREAYERLVQPLLGSIHTGDPERLSMSAILPRFVALEREHGSLVRGMLRQARQAHKARGGKSNDSSGSGARFSLFVAPRDGMTSLVDALAAELPAGAVRLNTRVARLAHHDDRWTLTLGDDRELDADGVVLATPARGAALLLDDVDPVLGELVGSIPHSRCAIVSLGYRREQIGHRLDGFGLVVPAVERRKLLSCSFSSIKYAGRAGDGSVLLRAFVGGTGQAELLERSDDQLQQTVAEELRQLLGVTGEPQLSQVSRAPAMPQYYLGHGERVSQIRRRAADLACFELVGNAYDGVGVPQCIHGAELAAERLIILFASQN
jgi:oxygen-dependent protoporphyrinogen oxidase